MGISKLKIPKICEQCGKPFEAKTVITRFCSTTCVNKSDKEKKREAKDAERKRNILEQSTNQIAQINPNTPLYFYYGKESPQRMREYLNRSVTTIEWDKKRTARTDADGTKSYEPKRDDNGIIICRSEKDQESMIYAEAFVNFANENMTMAIYTAMPKLNKLNKRNVYNKIS
ncbi:MAG: hypothetical protein AB2L20_14595 [Mangrovibacterium sp.]